MLALRFPQPTALDNVPASLKLLLLAAATSGIFFISTLGTMFLIFLAITTFHFLFGWQIFKFSLNLLKPLLPFIIIMVFWHLYSRDLTGGLLIIMRLLLIVSLANLVTCSTKTSEITEIIDKFKIVMENNNFAIHLEDERLSSQYAKKIMIQQDIKTGKNKEMVDVLSASIILQTYLDREK